MANGLGIAAAFVENLKGMAKAADVKQKSDLEFQQKAQLFDFNVKQAKQEAAFARERMQAFRTTSEQDIQAGALKLEVLGQAAEETRKKKEKVATIRGKIEREEKISPQEEIFIQQATQEEFVNPFEEETILFQQQKTQREQNDARQQQMERESFEAELDAFSTPIDFAEAPFLPTEPVLPEPLARPPAQAGPEIEGIQLLGAKELGLPPGTPDEVSGIVEEALGPEGVDLFAPPAPPTGADNLKTLTKSFRNTMREYTIKRNEVISKGLLDRHPEYAAEDGSSHPRVLTESDEIVDLRGLEVSERTRIDRIVGDNGLIVAHSDFTGPMVEEFNDFTQKVEKYRFPPKPGEEITPRLAAVDINSAITQVDEEGNTVIAADVKDQFIALAKQEDLKLQEGVDIGGGLLSFKKIGKSKREQQEELTGVLKEAGKRQRAVSMEEIAKAAVEKEQEGLFKTVKFGVFEDRAVKGPKIEINLGKDKAVLSQEGIEDELRPLVRAIIPAEGFVTDEDVAAALLKVFEEEDFKDFVAFNTFSTTRGPNIESNQNVASERIRQEVIKISKELAIEMGAITTAQKKQLEAERTEAELKGR